MKRKPVHLYSTVLILSHNISLQVHNHWLLQSLESDNKKSGHSHLKYLGRTLEIALDSRPNDFVNEILA